VILRRLWLRGIVAAGPAGGCVERGFAMTLHECGTIARSASGAAIPRKKRHREERSDVAIPFDYRQPSNEEFWVSCSRTGLPQPLEKRGFAMTPWVRCLGWP
jgi:hypothetical protein